MENLAAKILNDAISTYNETATDINKFAFSEKEKDFFCKMMKEYEEECVKSERDRIFSELFDVLPKDDKGDIELGDEIWHIIYNKEMPKQIK